jgi:hypothetical protein
MRNDKERPSRPVINYGLGAMTGRRVHVDVFRISAAKLLDEVNPKQLGHSYSSIAHTGALKLL